MGSGYTNYWGTMWDSTWEWNLKFARLPCRLDTGQWIWFKEYYHGVRVIHGPGTPVILHQYLTPQQHLFSMLKES